MADADARLERLRVRFDAADGSGKGELDRDALRNLLECTETFCLTKHWLPDDVLDAVMAKYDADNNGALDFDDFLDLAKDKVMLEGKLEEFDEAFKSVAGGKDEIDFPELKKLFEGLGNPKTDEELKDILGRVDRDGNGKVDFAEFLEMARTHIVELNDVVDYVALDGRKDGAAAPAEESAEEEGKGKGDAIPWKGAKAPPREPRPADTPLISEVESAAEFEAIVEAEKPGLVVLEVAFTWCRPCKGFQRKYERFAEHYKATRFVKVFGNANEDTKAFVKHKLEVKASPSFYVFRKTAEGDDPLKPVASWTGANEDRFRTNLNANLEEWEMP